MADYTLDRQVGQIVVPLAALAATQTGPSVDFGKAGVGKSITVNVHATAVSGTSPTLDCKLQDSADDVTYADITGASTTQITAAGNRVFAGYTTKRYVQVVATLGGSAGPSVTAAISVSAGLGD